MNKLFLRFLILGAPALLALPLRAQDAAPNPMPMPVPKVSTDIQPRIPIEFNIRPEFAFQMDELRLRLDNNLDLFAFQKESTDKIREQVRQATEAARQSAAIARTNARMDRGNGDYNQAMRSIERREWDKAVQALDEVIADKGTRTENAYYWKGYALNRLGRRQDALAALAELQKQFPQSRWINDAKALEVEVRQASGQPVSPESEANDDLKLLAINALMNSDPDRALPLLEKILNDPKNPPDLRKRALFVLAQTRNDKARAMVAQYAKSGSNPDLQLSAVEYLGIYGGKENLDTLAGIYSSVNDVNLKRSVLRGYMMARDSAHLLAAAKGESNPELRRDAITYLGTMHDDASNDALAALYPSTSDKETKVSILRALFVGRSAKQLVTLARGEKDPELKKQAVQFLANMKSPEATDYLIELLNR